MAIRPRYPRPEGDLGLHVLIGTFTVEYGRFSCRLSLKRKDIPSGHDDE
jgi:hypothetical protein